VSQKSRKLVVKVRTEAGDTGEDAAESDIFARARENCRLCE
jgi:hypothetical protein